MAPVCYLLPGGTDCTLAYGLLQNRYPRLSKVVPIAELWPELSFLEVEL